MSKDLAKTSHCILFCNGGSCVKNGAEQLTKEVRAYLRMEGLYNNTHTIKTLCMGRCADGPNIIMLPDNTWYKEMTIEKGIELVDKHIKGNELMAEHVLFQPGMKAVQSAFKTLHNSKKEFRIVEDPELGAIAVAQADAWEMNLYPMLMAIFIRYYSSVIITSLNEQPQRTSLAEPAMISYDNQVLKIVIKNHCAALIIGVITKNDDYTIQQERIYFVDIYKQLHPPFNHGIRFKNKAGKTKLNVFDSSKDLQLWKHFVIIYLEKEPDQIELINML